MTNLSPAAQAVLDAAYEVRPWMIRVDSGDIAAAALRAAADQVAPITTEHIWLFSSMKNQEKVSPIRTALLAIADELEIG